MTVKAGDKVICLKNWNDYKKGKEYIVHPSRNGGALYINATNNPNSESGNRIEYMLLMGVDAYPFIIKGSKRNFIAHKYKNKLVRK